MNDKHISPTIPWPSAKAERIARLRPDQPCGHPGCLHHVTHPCEGCGRIAGRWPDEISPVSEEPELPKPWILVSSENFKDGDE